MEYRVNNISYKYAPDGKEVLKNVSFSIEKGKDADLTIFDPATIRDRSDYPHRGKPDAKPDGIPYVLVNGCLTVCNGEYTGRRCGRIIRK